MNVFTPKVRIECGDALELLRREPEGSVNCVVTSPPYNQLGSRIPEHPTGMHARNAWIEKTNAVGYGDDMDEHEYQAWQIDLAEALARVVVPGGSFFYNHKVRYRNGAVLHPLELVRHFKGWTLRQEIVWDRGGAIAFNARMFAPSDERIYWLVRDGADYTWHQEAARNLTVWRIAPERGVGKHPCPFPEALVARCIKAATNEGDVVLDPFAGSGTTLAVALRLCRNAIGYELNPDYVDLIRKRTAAEMQPRLDLLSDSVASGARGDAR